MAGRFGSPPFHFCIMICFYHPSMFSSNIRLVEQLTCRPRPDNPWIAMYTSLPKESLRLPCVWPLVLHRETLEDWPWKNRNAEGPLWSYLLFGPLNLDLSIHKAFFNLLRCYRSAFYSDYFTPGGSLSSFFMREDANWSGILEALLSCVLFWTTSSSCVFWFIQGNELPPS